MGNFGMLAVEVLPQTLYDLLVYALCHANYMLICPFGSVCFLLVELFSGSTADGTDCRCRGIVKCVCS